MVSSKLLALLAAGSLVSLIAGCAEPPADPEAQGETESHQLAGTRLTPSQVASHLRAAGFAENTIGKMVCTAKYESSYYQKATNKNKNGSTDYGLLQVNSLHLGKTKNCPSSGSALFDPAANAKCAYSIFKTQGITAWYGYKAHKSECDRTKAPAGAAAPSTPVTADDDDDSTTTTSAPVVPTQSPADTSTGSGADTDAPDDAGPMIDPDADYDLGANCWSATMQDSMPAHSCVQQVTSNVWFQCKDGQWYRGGDDVTGPYGYCNGSYPLAQ